MGVVRVIDVRLHSVFQYFVLDTSQEVRIPMYIDTSRPSFGFSCWTGMPGPMTGAHRHDDVEFNVASRDVGYVLNGTRAVLPAHHVGVFWASRPHQLIEVPADTTVTWLTVPLFDFLAWRLPRPFISALVHGRMLIPSILPADAGARFDRWIEDLGARPDFVVGTAQLEVQAFARRLSLAVDLGTGTVRDAADDVTVEAALAMAAFVSRHFAESLSVSDVATSVHLHPSYAMASFKRRVGVSIGAYLTQCRVAEAQRLLIASDIRIGEIGTAAGFGSTSQFHDRFREACGTTPAAYRRAHRSVFVAP